ncbi:hypothetical protein ACVRWQ_02785 [Streptococcus phocae subsp. salmonis]|uniref:hypothetical protein n=1 Tax=Streptococcus phocae TaxID=119224 RepID=UPI000531193C|nr:hypothetical protein [Streptococcus phocae]KGR72758.1 hypothetical protein NX86_04630 [Streptococcus phocae subsp. salmonis]
MFKQLKNNEGNASRENKGLSIKALTFGVAVVVIGLVCLGLGGHTAFAENSSYSDGYHVGYQKGFEAGYLNPTVDADELEKNRSGEFNQDSGYRDGYGTGFHKGVEAGQKSGKKGNMFLIEKSWKQRLVDNIRGLWWNAKGWWQGRHSAKR